MVEINEVKRRIVNISNRLFYFLYKIKPLKKKNNHKKQVLILPPDRFGSLGDEAMIIAVINNLKKKGLNCDVLSFKNGSWEERLKDIEGYNNEIIINSKFGNPLNFQRIISTVSEYNCFVIIGADIMDGYYSTVESIKRLLLGRISSEMGLKAIVTACSFNNNIHHLVKKELSKMENSNFTLNIRDVNSFNNIKEFYKTPVLSSDVSFLLEPPSTFGYVELEEFIDKSEFITININSLHYNKYGDWLIQYFKTFISYILTNTNLNVVLAPHDIRENTFSKYSDYEILISLYKIVDNVDRVFVLNKKSKINAIMLKQLAYKSKLVIAGRLHFCIAALSNKVPVLVMPYQDKFEGILSDIYTTPESYILLEFPNNVQELVSKTLFILNNLKQEKELIKIEELKAKSIINFELF